MITRVEKGLVNDDFIHDRITLKAYLDSGNYMPCKLYPDGRIVTFSGGWPEIGDYTERPIDNDLANEIKAKL